MQIMSGGKKVGLTITTKQTLMHRTGMALSGLCLAHCLLLPVLLAAAPLALVTWLPLGWAGGLADTEWFHAALIAPVVLVSGPALMRAGGLRVGVLIFSVGALVAALFVASEALEIGLTVAGALSLLAAHWLTLRRERGDGQA